MATINNNINNKCEAGLTVTGGNIILGSDDVTSTIDIGTGSTSDADVLVNIGNQSGGGGATINIGTVMSQPFTTDINIGTGHGGGPNGGPTIIIGNTASGSTVAMYGAGSGFAVPIVLQDSTGANITVGNTSRTGTISVTSTASTTITSGSGGITLDADSDGITTTNVYGVVPSGGTNEMVIINSATGQLGSQAISGGIGTIDGDSGSATGSTVTLTGGTSGAVFTGSGTTLTESFIYLSLPASNSTNGQIRINTFPALWAPLNSSNIFVGILAGNSTLSGGANSGLGQNALSSLTSGDKNTASGYLALTALQGGVRNTAIGYEALTGSVSDSYNTALGAFSLIALNGGTDNTCLGYNSGGALLTGSNNTLIGSNAGTFYTGAEGSNVCINSYGVLYDTHTLRIGTATGTGTQQLNQAYISGIQGISVTGSAVLVSSSDQLGVTVSSKRWKDNIEDMSDVSSPILDLRPVTFTYSIGDDKSQQVGLIAEEVQEVMPALVVLDKEGLPQTVKYHELPVLLLNELQKALKRIEALEAKVGQ